MVTWKVTEEQGTLCRALSCSVCHSSAVPPLPQPTPGSFSHLPLPLNLHLFRNLSSLVERLHVESNHYHNFRVFCPNKALSVSPDGYLQLYKMLVCFVFSQRSKCNRNRNYPFRSRTCSVTFALHSVMLGGCFSNTLLLTT